MKVFFLIFENKENREKSRGLVRIGRVTVNTNSNHFVIQGKQMSETLDVNVQYMCILYRSIECHTHTKSSPMILMMNSASVFF